MFRTAAPGHQRTAEGFSAALTQWRDSSDTWFDGSAESVDHRLRRCARLLTTANAAAGRLALGDAGQYLAAIQELSADKQALAGLREDLLTGYSGRGAAGVSPPSGRTATKRAQLSGAERRWVELESARFLNANADVAHAPEELTERARRHAEAHTWTVGAKRSRVVTAAFVEKAAALGRAIPRPRVAAAPDTIPDFDPALMFLA